MAKAFCKAQQKAKTKQKNAPRYYSRGRKKKIFSKNLTRFHSRYLTRGDRMKTQRNKMRQIPQKRQKPQIHQIPQTKKRGSC